MLRNRPGACHCLSPPPRSGDTIAGAREREGEGSMTANINRQVRLIS